MTQKDIKILMVDDDEEDFIIIRDLIEETIGDSYDVLRYSYKLEWVQSYDQGLAAILEKRHDVYLIDYRLGIHTGLDLITEAIARGCEAPLLLLTGQSDLQVDAQAMLAGAADYLVKGKTSARQLESAIRYSIQQAKHLHEIKALNATLEVRVSERTRVLEETISELSRTKEELDIALHKEKDLNDLKSRFVSMASHEFRTPLATMLSSLSLVIRYGEVDNKEQQMKHLMRIKSSISTLTDLINDVLSVSSLDEGRIEVSCERINIAQLAESIVGEMKDISKSGQQVHFSHAGDSMVLTDPKLIRHILVNLLSNAIKFSSEQKPIWLDLKVEEGNVQIDVRDEGIGISEADQSHLFERFFRAKNAGNIQGTGLGLNIVAKFVELLNGSIACHSVLKEGTTFTVRLPKQLAQ